MLFYSWYPAVMLAFEAGSVIDMRLRKIARGGEQGAAESRLMVMEKVDALFEAGSLLVGGGSAAELVEMSRCIEGMLPQTQRGWDMHGRSPTESLGSVPTR